MSCILDELRRDMKPDGVPYPTGAIYKFLKLLIKGGGRSSVVKT